LALQDVRMANTLLGSDMKDSRPWRVEDLTGKRFGRLVAIRPVGQTKSRNTTWLFRCDCGGNTITTKDTAARPNAGCGCQLGKKIKHGHRPKSGKTREYTSWQSMKARCLNPKHIAYDKYGGAGITIDPAWIKSFKAFLQDVGPCPEDCNSIDRKENAKGYFKENVRWSTAKWQANNRTSNVTVTANGITETLAQACRRHRTNYTTAKRRLERGLSGDAVFAPCSHRARCWK
jgi:hypothetical protein